MIAKAGVHRLTKEQEAEIIKMYNDGFGQERIAKSMGFCQATIGNVLRRNHVRTSPGRLRRAKRWGHNVLDWYDEDIIR